VIATKIRNRIYQIPQALPADRSAFRYKKNASLDVAGPARFAKDQFGSQKPKLPQGKSAGFIRTRKALTSR